MGSLPTFQGIVAARGLNLAPQSVTTLQLNVTKLCNQACVHCHVDSSPRRREMMSDAVLDQCLTLLERHPGITTLDITGGAPELHPRFRDLVMTTRRLGRRVMVRHNLTVTLDPHPLTKESMAYLPEFFAAQHVDVVSSLPCYQEANTNKQRGDGVYQKSMTSLQLLNELGYGREDTGLKLDLVYNPVGAFLPPSQATLERDYKLALKRDHGIVFNRLLALTNMPIHRFKAQLRRTGGYEAYMETLAAAFNPGAAEGIMCRSLVSVAHDGTLYDCDFNQMLNMQIEDEAGQKLTVFDATLPKLLARQIKFADHCFGCTAGAGSSCGGTTA
jgi:radical SAM/Cys-rich protein